MTSEEWKRDQVSREVRAALAELSALVEEGVLLLYRRQARTGGSQAASATAETAPEKGKHPDDA